MQRIAKSAFIIRFQAHGLSLEKLLRTAGESGISLSSIKRVNAKEITGIISESDFILLKEMADARGWTVEKGAAIGLSAFRNKIFKQWGMAMGFAALIVVMVVAMQFVWVVDILDAGPYEGDIRAFLEEHDIRPGILKSAVSTLKLQEQLEARYPDTAWVKATYRGGNLVIRMIRGVPVPLVESYGDANDVVAACDGIVVSVLPYAGTPMVKTGDMVKKGQVLVKGEERAGVNGEMKAVKALGKVTARFWLGARVRVSMEQKLSIPTGNITQSQWIKTPLFNVFEDKTSPYEIADAHIEIYPVVGVFFPVSVYRVTWHEVSIQTTISNIEQAKEESGRAAQMRLNEKMTPNDELVDKWVDYCMIEGKVMEATAYAEVIRDIAQEGTPP